MENAPNKPAVKENTLIQTFIYDQARIEKYLKYHENKNFFSNTRSKDIDKIVEAKIGFKRACPKLIKDQHSGTGTAKYQTFGAMLAVIFEPMAANGLDFSQLLHVYDKTSYVVTELMHISGQYIRSVTMLPPYAESMLVNVVKTGNDMKAYGAASSYLKRYALKSILGIEPDNDDYDGSYQK